MNFYIFLWSTWSLCCKIPRIIFQELHWCKSYWAILMMHYFEVWYATHWRTLMPFDHLFNGRKSIPLQVRWTYDKYLLEAKYFTVKVSWFNASFIYLWFHFYISCKRSSVDSWIYEVYFVICHHADSCFKEVFVTWLTNSCMFCSRSDLLMTGYCYSLAHPCSLFSLEYQFSLCLY